MFEEGEKMADKKSAIQDLMELQTRLNSLISEVVSPQVGEKSSFVFKPLADVSEDDKNYYIEMELPGVEIKDIEILCEENNVKIRGERKLSREIAPDNVFRMERFFGEFSREFFFASPVQKDKVEANLSNGILVLILPKKNSVQKIEIK